MTQARFVLPHRALHNLEIQQNFEAIEAYLTEQDFSNTVGMAYRNAAQKIKTTEFNVVKVDKVISDPGGNFNLANGYYVVPSTGYYLVTGNVNLLTNVAEYDVIALVLVNGVEKVRGVQVEKLGGGSAGCVVAGIVRVEAGKHIELAVYQSSGVEKELQAALEQLNQLCVVRVA